MPTEWITRPHREEWIEYSHEFRNVDHPSSGFSYECDADGNLKLDPDVPQLEQWFEESKALAQAGTLHYLGVQERPRAWFNSGTIRCTCGAVHDLQRGDSRCDACGQLYNAVGQQLCEPHLWEERFEADY